VKKDLTKALRNFQIEYPLNFTTWIIDHEGIPRPASLGGNCLFLAQKMRERFEGLGFSVSTGLDGIHPALIVDDGRESYFVESTILQETPILMSAIGKTDPQHPMATPVLTQTKNRTHVIYVNRGAHASSVETNYVYEGIELHRASYDMRYPSTADNMRCLYNSHAVLAAHVRPLMMRLLEPDNSTIGITLHAQKDELSYRRVHRGGTERKQLMWESAEVEAIAKRVGLNPAELRYYFETSRSLLKDLLCDR